MPANRNESTLSSVSQGIMEDVTPDQLTPITTLGRGSYGKVVLAKVNNDDTQDDLVAVKIIAKSRLKNKNHLEKTQSELEVMRKVCSTSNWLVSTRGAYQTDSCLIVTMPYSAGGELFFHLNREGKFSESKTRLITMQVVMGLEHLHHHGVLYRDLKPENVLITHDGRCQLADFGLSKFLPKVKSSEIMSQMSSSRRSSDNKQKRKSFVKRLFSRKSTTSKNVEIPKEDESEEENGLVGYGWGTTKTRCGTPAYQAPEIVEAKEHGLESDWWALGVLVYELLTGEPPFFASTVKEVYEIILTNKPRYPKRMSPRAKSFIQDLLTSDRFARLGYGIYGAEDVKSHAFFMEIPDEAKAASYPSWESVSKLQADPVVFLSEAGIVGTPEDAVFFHTEFTTIDVREYVKPAKQKFQIGNFEVVPEKDFELFVSPEPIQVVFKDQQQQQEAADTGPSKD